MKTIVVTAAVVERNGAFLVTRRLTGTHLAGTWEFPGGKCEDDEPLDACRRRGDTVRRPMKSPRF